MVSAFSFAAAIIWFNVSMLVVSYLGRKTYFLAKYSTSFLVLFALLGMIRMLLPLDLPEAYVIPSYTVLPAIRRALEADISLGTTHISVSLILVAIWGIGTLIVLIKNIAQLIRERNLRKQYTVIESTQMKRISLQLKLRKADIIVTPDVSSPNVIGLFRAHIYLPDIEITDSDWELILRHEYQHFEHHDFLIKLFYLVLSTVFWWNPAVHKFQKRLDYLLEVRCDGKVTKNMDTAGKISYLESIMSVMKQFPNSGNKAQLLGASPLMKTGDDEDLIKRFEVIVSEQKKSRGIQILLTAALIFFFLLSYMVLVQSVEYATEEDLDGGISITPENAYIRVSDDGTMQLYVDGVYYWDVNEEDLTDDLHSVLPIIDR